VPFAAHGQEFSFVLGLLDRKNCNDGHTATDSTLSTSEMIATEGNAILNSDANGVNCIPMKSETSLQQTKRTGALLQMDLIGGVNVIRSCIDVARKRTVGRLGSFNIKGVTLSGCKDLGLG
jgi:hypothetical protein